MFDSVRKAVDAGCAHVLPCQASSTSSAQHYDSAIHRVRSTLWKLVRPFGDPGFAGRSAQQQHECLSDREMLKFGSFPIERAEVFAQTVLSFAFVNLKPIVPGNHSPPCPCHTPPPPPTPPRCRSHFIRCHCMLRLPRIAAAVTCRSRVGVAEAGRAEVRGS